MSNSYTDKIAEGLHREICCVRGDLGNYLPLAGGTMDEDAIIAFDNGAAIRENPDGPGLDLVCSIEYVHRWKNGLLYIIDQSNQIRVVKYGLGIVPDATFDDTQGYLVGSIFYQDDETKYVCTDNTTGAAVWRLSGQIGGDTRPYKVYSASVTYSTGSNTLGTLLVFENTLGIIPVFTPTGASFTCNISALGSGVFQNKTQLLTNSISDINGLNLTTSVNQSTGILTFTYSAALLGGSTAVHIEIRVYN